MEDKVPARKRPAKSPEQVIECALQQQSRLRSSKLSQLMEEKMKVLRLMDDVANVERVKSCCLPRLDELFGDFREANLSLVNLQSCSKSEDQLSEEQRNWFEPKAKEFGEFRDKVGCWIKEARQPVRKGAGPENRAFRRQMCQSGEGTAASKSFGRNACKSGRRHGDGPSFSGNPLHYLAFMKSFERDVERTTDDERELLYYLDQCTSGEPREIVQSFYCMKQGGYKEAKKLLYEYYGSYSVISTAYVEKALNWPNVEEDDAATLDAFLCFLVSCQRAMAQTDYLDELNAYTILTAIARKLPDSWQREWVKRDIEIMTQTERKVKFGDLVEFVQEQVDQANYRRVLELRLYKK